MFVTSCSSNKNSLGQRSSTLVVGLANSKWLKLQQTTQHSLPVVESVEDSMNEKIQAPVSMDVSPFSNSETWDWSC